MAKNKDAFVQNDESNQLMNGRENVQNDEGAAAGGEDIKNETGGENQETEEGTGNGEDQESVSKILTAVYPILYLSHQYRVGEELPANDPEMVEAWIAAGTAVWMPAVDSAARAKPWTAEPGLPGQALYSESEDGENLAGKVPKTGAGRR